MRVCVWAGGWGGGAGVRQNKSNLSSCVVFVCQCVCDFYCAATQLKAPRNVHGIARYTNFIGLDWIGLDWISILGAAKSAVSPVGVDDLEYTYPSSLRRESVQPLLVDGGFSPNTLLSDHVTVRDVIARDHRYFRLDSVLLECIELAKGDFNGTIEVKWLSNLALGFDTHARARTHTRTHTQTHTHAHTHTQPQQSKQTV
jgi:hypothetical protein